MNIGIDAPGVAGVAPGGTGDWTEKGGRGRVLTCGEVGGLYVYGVDLCGTTVGDELAIVDFTPVFVHRCIWRRRRRCR